MVQLPIAVFCIFGITCQTVPHKPEDPANGRKNRSLDLPGLLTFTMTMISFLVVLDLGARPDGLENPLVIVFAILFLIFGLAFLFIEAYWAERPMIPLTLIKRPSVGLHYLAQMLCMCAQFAVSAIRRNNGLATILLTRTKTDGIESCHFLC